LLPSTGSLFNHLLRDVTPAERAAILESLRHLSNGKRLPPAPAPEPKPSKEPNQPVKFAKPKRDVRKAQAVNPVKARAEIEEQAKVTKELEQSQPQPVEEKPKFKPPVGAVNLGFGALGAQVALKQQAKYSGVSAQQKGETNEVSGKAQEKEELKPETAPQRGTMRTPAMGVGSFDAAALKAGLKKANQ